MRFEKIKNDCRRLGPYLALWSTQSLSALGSAMTNFALIIWLYQKSGSALETALLSACSYAPYVLMSIFAGALSDRWDKRRTMLACDLLAAASTVAVLVLLKSGRLQPWHMYILNAINGLMNTVQQPASDVAATLLIPREYYQKTCGLRSFSQSLITILTPVFATALFAFSGMDWIIAADLGTFALAFLALLFFIRIPNAPSKGPAEPVLQSAKTGLKWLKKHPLILNLILFLACINLVASAFEAALPAMLLTRKNGGETALGLVNAFAGIATLAGSVLVALTPAPKNRVKIICLTLTLSMSTENFLLAFGRTPWVWCAGSVLGWLSIPIMNANLDVILRTSIPVGMQGRVYACRNTLQFFTIPVGYVLGGALVDDVFTPLAQSVPPDQLAWLLGGAEGAGAALTFLALGVAGVLVCAAFSRILRRYAWNDADAAKANP